MSIKTTGSSSLTLPSPGAVRSVCCWGIIPSASGSVYQSLIRFEKAVSNRWAGNFYSGDEGVVSVFAGLFNPPTEQINDLSSDHINVWVFTALVWDGGTNTLHYYERLEGDVALTHYSLSTGAFTPTDLNIFADLTGGNAVLSGGYVSAIKAWTGILDGTELLAESSSRAPVRTSGLSTYLSCSAGTTIGDDESGNNYDWTVNGSGLSLDANEPSVFGSGPVDTPMTISATQVQVLTRTRGIGVIKSAVAAQVLSSLRAIAPIAKSATAAQTASRVRAVDRPATVTQSQVLGTAPVTTGIGATLTATQTQVPSLASRALARALLYVAAQTLTRARALARSLTATGLQVPEVDVDQGGGGDHPMTISVTAAQTVTVLRAIDRALALTQLQVPTRQRALARALSVVAAATAAVTKAAGHVASATAVQVPSRERALGLARAIAAVQTPSRARSLQRLWSATQTQVLSRLRAIGRASSATQTSEGSMVKGSGYLVEVSADAVQVPTRARELGASKSVTHAQTPTRARALERARSVTQAQTPSRLRGITRQLSVTSTGTPDASKGTGFAVEVEAEAAQVPLDPRRSLGLPRTVTQAQVPTRSRALGLVRAIVQSQLLSRLRAFAREIFGLQAQLPTEDHHQGINYDVEISVTQAQTPNEYRAVSTFVLAGPDATIHLPPPGDTIELDAPGDTIELS